MRIGYAIAIVAICGLPLPVRADSDGYFCTARGYVAFETRLASDNHELHIIRFSTAEGITAMPVVELENFQVHGMRCHASEVEVVGWNRTYTVNLSNLTITSRPSGAAGRGTGAAENLGKWARSQVVELEASGADQFQLVIARVSDGAKNKGIEHHTVTRLIQRRPQVGGQIVRSLQLFEGVFQETVD